MAEASELLSREIPHSLLPGWNIRRDNFGAGISFFAPSLKRFSTEEFSQRCDCSFPAVSITGSRCQLMCRHCAAVILKHMTPAPSPEALLARADEFRAAGARGMLVSGGSSRTGVVPLAGFIDAIARIVEQIGLKVIVHTGITDRTLARSLARAGVAAAMIDIIGADDTISGVCNLNGVTTADYEMSLANLGDAGVPVSPHVVIGLDHGAIVGERRALAMISAHPVSSLVLVGLAPQPGTPMADCRVPAPESMAELFLEARQSMPHTRILLGCERPAGDHKLKTDELALKAGLNGIAYPAEGIIGLARDLGLEVGLSEMCCALGESP